MLETLLNPRKAERRPWELFFVGLLYAALSLIMVNWLFGGNPIFSKHISILIITFTVMLSIPFMYFTIKFEEERKAFYREETENGIIKGHGRAIMAFTWLFIGLSLIHI